MHKPYPVRPSSAALVQVAKSHSQSAVSVGGQISTNAVASVTGQTFTNDTASIINQTSTKAIKPTNSTRISSSQFIGKEPNVQNSSSDIPRKISSIKRVSSSKIPSDGSKMGYLHIPSRQESEGRIYYKTVNRKVLQIPSVGSGKIQNILIIRARILMTCHLSFLAR